MLVTILGHACQEIGVILIVLLAMWHVGV